ncbi:hypothetical protein [Bradyrhizobium sp. 170]|uniref:hypothetical protein n=1 Tax=Bradyrhizobium sp. 170 TaxID=2782641 RepID=UPI0020002A65|nr:hypothetical protein [Bradyrhizobium sp. 170]UPK04147.1 hypothetical protein IVB05_42980 [Bradyrhizobium sp. 170]
MTVVAADALVSLAVLIALLFVVYGPWQWACTDYARQRLFEVRDEIFDMAADGELNFKSQAYRDIRRSLEMNIRFAHDLTLPNFLLLLILRKDNLTEKSTLRRAIEDLPPEIRAKVARKVFVAMKALIVMMIVKSPVAMIVGLPVYAATRLINSCRVHVSKAAAFCADLIQVEAENAPSAIRFHSHQIVH